jgi:hypothetical protein
MLTDHFEEMWGGHGEPKDQPGYAVDEQQRSKGRVRISRIEKWSVKNPRSFVWLRSKMMQPYGSLSVGTYRIGRWLALPRRVDIDFTVEGCKTGCKFVGDFYNFTVLLWKCSNPPGTIFFGHRG